MNGTSTRCRPALEEDRAARMLAALGSPVRLRVYRLLLRAGEQGINVSSFQRAIGIPPSTLNHHLAALRSAGLITQEKTGRELLCRAEYSDIRRLSAFLLQECCADAPAAILKMLSAAA